MNQLFLYCSLFLMAMSIVEPISLSQKRKALSSDRQAQPQSLEGFSLINKQIREKKEDLHKLYRIAQQEYLQNPNAQNQTLIETRLKEISLLRSEILSLEEEWKELYQKNNEQEHEGLWHQPDTTIGQLVVDYGSCDYIYLVPPDVAALKIHISSQLSVPRALWNEMLELILANYGIGIVQLNPLLRQLYFLRNDQSALVAISDDRLELKLLNPDSKICFLLQPDPMELRRIYQFLEKFVPQDQMSIQIFSNSIVVVGLVREITELLKIYDFICHPKHMQEWKVVPLKKAQSEEVSTILQSLFEAGNVHLEGLASNEGGKKKASKQAHSEGIETLRVITLKQPSQSLILIGKTEQIAKAIEIIDEIEKRLSEVQDKSIHWYACKHSEAEELADVLSQVYSKMTNSPDAQGKGKKQKGLAAKSAPSESQQDSDNLVVHAPKITMSDPSKKQNYEKNENFVVDNKTNSIIMVVEPDILPKMRELLKKLDVPKRMIQIDILLFEKRISDNNSFGLNLLRTGEAASHKHVRSAIWNAESRHRGRHRRHHRHHNRHHHHHRRDHHDRREEREEEEFDEDRRGDAAKGVFQFLISRTRHGFIPAFDIAYNFLLSQEDVRINANPTVTTVNQTPVKFAVVEQISINTGVVEIDAPKATRLKDSYSREEYGTTIQITPTVHAKMDDEDDPQALKFIHLATDVIFDTTHPSEHDRPDVTRRNIKNEVRVADGETIILGGLRKKFAQDKGEHTPFLGELPGVGKLFSISHMSDTNTEMFIFITPRIVPDKLEEARQMRRKELLTRPGDLPEFLHELEKIQESEKRTLFESSMKMLLGR